MATKVALLGDPRRPQDVHRCPARRTDADKDDTPHMSLLMGCMLNGMAIMAQSKLLIALGVALILHGMVNFSWTSSSSRSLLMMGVMTVGWAVSLVYFQQGRRRGAGSGADGGSSEAAS